MRPVGRRRSRTASVSKRGEEGQHWEALGSRAELGGSMRSGLTMTWQPSSGEGARGERALGGRAARLNRSSEESGGWRKKTAYAWSSPVGVAKGTFPAPVSRRYYES
ncbi:hypothetical protein PVAP13_6NG221700 [Panicum virgatum]|uniref:Uncharacterized protein n=1 Tax=Panicum virgatum TaxID=38727 RepID=A0A8T0QY05_PANVG|nr:hypothetical protein PVAP13_6NG221700 [Panicum virgatum]